MGLEARIPTLEIMRRMLMCPLDDMLFVRGLDLRYGLA
jgi:hypothetical protein